MPRNREADDGEPQAVHRHLGHEIVEAEIAAPEDHATLLR